MNKKYTLEFVKQSFESEGYILLSTEYKGAHSYLNFICPNKHEHKIMFANWQRGQRCGKCLNNYPIKYEFVKIAFENEGYQLLSTEYKNAHQYLEFICPKGHKHKIKWGEWKHGRRCGLCFGTHKPSYDFVKQSFKKEGYQLLSTEYINNRQYLNYICPIQHKHKIIWNAWIKGVRCPKCSMNGISKPEKEILDFVKSNYNGIIKENDRTLIENPKTGYYLELDIWLPEIRKAIEYNGEFYHRGKNVKFRDNYKQKWCKENGIELLIIDDKKWRKNKDFNMINSFICGLHSNLNVL